MHQVASKAALLVHLHALATVDGSAPPPEQAQIEAAAQGLPEGSYNVYDPELGPVPGWLNVLPATPLAEWQGTEPGSWGYGDVRQLLTAQGLGLVIAVGGGIQSACSLYVVPAECAAVAEYE